MNGAVQDFIQRHVESTLDIKGRVLEVGSRDICGSARRWFTKGGLQKEPTERFPEYIGIDIVEGNLVDRIMNAHSMDFEDGSFDVVVSTSTLEHDSDPFQTMREIERVMKAGGWLLLSVPGWKGCGPHCENDYWRFLEDGVRLLVKNVGLVVVELMDKDNDVMVLARKAL